LERATALDEGFDNHQMIEATYEDKLKAMYLFGEEMSLVDSNANFVGQGLSKLESFVVQDIFSATCHFADVVLPASPSLEKEGTFTSTERRIQRLYQVFEPLEGSRPDWIIIQDIAIASVPHGSISIPPKFIARSLR
jgi:formate dehydrogenase major subunit